MTTVFTGGRALDARGESGPSWILVDGDTITATGEGTPPRADTMIDTTGLWMTPGFIDLHAHGGGGHSYDSGAESIRAALETHRAHGTTRSVLSLVAAPIAVLRSGLETVAELSADDPLILGSHLEGPYLAPSRRGAHHHDYLRQPDQADIATLIQAANGTLRQTTLAPELPGGLDAVSAFAEAGIRVAIGHTEADAATARAAFDRGATILTHAFNGMPGIHHRAPGPIMAAFGDKRVTIELVLDGRHVDVDVAALAFTAAPDRIALVTDAMAAAGSEDGDYRLGALNVAVRDGVAMLRGTNTLAGSTLTQDAALRRAITQCGLSPADAVAALTRTPARALGEDHRLGLLDTGYAADILLLDSAWQVGGVWAAGRQLA